VTRLVRRHYSSPGYCEGRPGSPPKQDWCTLTRRSQGGHGQRSEMRPANFSSRARPPLRFRDDQGGRRTWGYGEICLERRQYKVNCRWRSGKVYNLLRDSELASKHGQPQARTGFNVSLRRRQRPVHGHNGADIQRRNFSSAAQGHLLRSRTLQWMAGGPWGYGEFELGAFDSYGDCRCVGVL